MKTRVVFVGNTNNELFRFASDLSSLNDFSVTSILIQRGALHDPASLPYFDRRRFQGIVKDLRSFDEESQIVFSREYLDLILRFTREAFVILDGTSVSLAPLIKRPYACFVAGSNLTFYARSEFPEWRTKSWSSEYKATNKGMQAIRRYEDFSTLQLEGFKNSDFLISVPRGFVPKEDEILSGIAAEILRIPWIRFSISKRRPVFRSPSNDVLVAVRLDRADESQPGDSERSDKGIDRIVELCVQILGTDTSRLTIVNKGKSANEVITKLLEYAGGEKKIMILDELPYKKFLKILRSYKYVIDSLGRSPIGRISVDSISLGKIPVTSMSKEQLAILFPTFLNVPAISPSQLIEALDEGIDIKPATKIDLRVHNQFSLDRIKEAILRSMN